MPRAVRKVVQTRAAERRGQAPSVSVIVPHYQDLDGLERCLDSLARQTLPRGEFEIVVSDNNSPVGQAAVAAVVGQRARLVVCPDRGAGPTRNAGVAASSGRILAFIDSDCVAEPGWLAAGVEALKRHDFVGGRMKVLVSDATDITPTEAFEAVFAFDNERYVRKMGFSVTANLLSPRPLFLAVGGFRVGVAEDKEWCLRAGAAGYRIGYVEAAVVGHPARRSWEELERKWVRLNREAFEMSREQRGGKLVWLLRSLAVPASAVAHTPRVFASPALSWRERFAALGVLYRLRWWRFVNAMGLLASDR